MLNPYHEKIDISRIIELQNYQYQNALYLEEEIPAASQRDAAVNITSIGHFMLLSITGSYTTKIADTPATDDNINHLFVQLVDGANHRELFDDYIPANLFLSPGREKVIAGAPADVPVSSPLYLEYPFIYTFPLNGQILVRIRNDSDYANRLRIMFKGIRIFNIQRQDL